MLVNGTEVADLEEKLEELEAEYVTLSEENDILAEEYGRVLNQLKWTHSMLCLLIEEQGGLVHVAIPVAREYSGEELMLQVYEDEEENVLVVAVTEREDTE